MSALQVDSASLPPHPPVLDDRINLGNVLTLQNSSWALSLWVKTTDTSTVGDTGFSELFAG